MDPVIYSLQKHGVVINIDKILFSFSSDPPPKLIKYGFNNINDQLDMNHLMANEHYKTALEYNLKDLSMIDANHNNRTIVDAAPGVFDQLFAEIWEIMTTFNIMSSDKANIIITTHPNTMKDMFVAYEKIADAKNIKCEIIDYVQTKNTKNITGNIIFYHISDIDIDENTVCHLILQELSHLMAIQEIGSHLIIELFNIQTQACVELIYYLLTQYDETYLIKPSIVSDLFDKKYIVLVKLINKVTLAEDKIPDDLYVSSLGFSNLPESFTSSIQCINSSILTKKYKKYYFIKAYLDKKIFEGIQHEELLATQRKNIVAWFNNYVVTLPSRKVLDDAVDATGKKCDSYIKLVQKLSI